MIAEYKTKTNVGIGLGIIWMGACVLVVRQGGPLAEVGSVLIYLTPVFYFYGYSRYAIGKGHSGWWGLLGFLQLIGLLGLVCLPDKHKDG